MSRTSASLETCSAPTGVSMSTFFSCPSPSFLTLTLQPGRASRTPKAKTRAKARRELSLSGCVVRMLRSLLCDLCGALDAGAALSDIGNADRQVAMNRGLAKKSFDRADFRNAGIGKSTKIVLYSGEILCHVRIPHGNDSGFRRSMIQNRLQQRSAGIVERDRIRGTIRACDGLARGWNHINRRDHG